MRQTGIHAGKPPRHIINLKMVFGIMMVFFFSFNYSLMRIESFKRSYVGIYTDKHAYKDITIDDYLW